MLESINDNFAFVVGSHFIEVFDVLSAVAIVKVSTLMICICFESCSVAVKVVIQVKFKLVRVSAFSRVGHFYVFLNCLHSVEFHSVTFTY